MDDKRNSLLTVGLICAVLFILGIADLCNSDRVYSETENRVLASRPTFSWESLLSGEYGDDYEEYMSDQFVGRDKWVGIKTRADILFQKKEINGVYLGADRYLIGVNDPEKYTEQMEDSRIASLKKLVNRWDAKVMLVPTADNILTDKLPAFAPHYDETRLLTKVKESVALYRCVFRIAGACQGTGLLPDGSSLDQPRSLLWIPGMGRQHGEIPLSV